MRHTPHPLTPQHTLSPIRLLCEPGQHPAAARDEPRQQLQPRNGQLHVKDAAGWLTSTNSQPAAAAAAACQGVRGLLITIAVIRPEEQGEEGGSGTR